MVASRVGGAYDPEILRRDAQALYKTGRFSAVTWETEESRSGPVVRFVLVERPVIESIESQVGDMVSVGEIMERLEQRKVRVRVETLCNEEELERAAAVVRELMAERGGGKVTVTPLVVAIGPEAAGRVKVVFRGATD
jgi:outer membrane protein assembly factor BamA